MAIEKLQQDSEKSLEQHKQDIIGALAEEKDALAEAPDNNPLATEVLSKAMGGSVFAAAAAVHNDLSSSKPANSIFVGGMSKKNQGSIFVGGGSAGNNKAAHARPIVPMSYSEKKSALKNSTAKPARDADIFARSRLSGMSLTGSSTAGGKVAPVKGLTASAAAAKMIRIAELKQELAVVNNALENPYDAGTKRLAGDFSRGGAKAKTFVQQNPEAARVVTPKAQSQFNPAGRR
jgi:hypothetical protein